MATDDNPVFQVQDQFSIAVKDAPVLTYLSPNSADVAVVAAFAFDLEQRVLQAVLSPLGLPEALIQLHQHGLFKGFVQDSLKQLKRIRICDRKGKNFWLAHTNPARVNRAAGAGRPSPPVGIDLNALPNGTCFLERINQIWQQRFSQLAYTILLDGEAHVCCVNPFPFGAVHCTIATEKHIDQRWSNRDDLAHVIRSLVELSAKLPGWVVLLNGSSKAGASIPGHRHYQVFQMDGAQRPFPLQLAASTALNCSATPIQPLVGGVDYPITVFRVRGGANEVIRATIELVARWRMYGDSCSENLIAIHEAGNVTIYFAPRDDFANAPGLAGAIASLEILGEFLFCTETEIRSLMEGAVCYQWLWDALQAVAPPAAVELAGSSVIVS